MMTSLRNKINLVFSVTFVLLAALFMASIKYDQSQYLERTEAQEREIVHYIYNYYLQTGKVDEAYLDAQNMSLITDKGMLVQIESFFKEKGKYKRYAVDTFRLKRVLLINNDRFKLILENKNQAKFPFKRVIVFSIVFVLILILYMWIIRSLRPLSILKNKIQTFSQGNLNISCKSDKNDEIAEVANEFDHAVEMIRELLQSRQLFLRAIMHELKTPIGKGRLVSEMLPDEKNRTRMHSIFERLNLLIDEFAKIEQITSKNFQLAIKPYKASDLVEASIDLLMFENPKQHISTEIIKDFELEVDFELFTLTLKNLLDNGIKYSTDKHIKAVINQGSISIENRGERLKEPIENYFKPFHTSKQGLGLGLYIVKSILDIHKMELGYEHDEGINRFTVKI
ncbi:MAG: ArsS family sensor histidine kinase [Sulfurovum sp.]